MRVVAAVQSRIRLRSILLAVLLLPMVAVLTARDAQAIPTVIATIDTGANIYAVDVNPITNRIYVTHANGPEQWGSCSAGYTSVVNGETNTVVSTIELPNTEFDIAVNPNTNRIYVTSHNCCILSVIDGATDTKMADIPLGGGTWGGCWGVTVNPATNRVYANKWSTLYVIDGDTNAIVGTTGVASNAYFMDTNPLTNRIYVSDFDYGVSVIDGSTNAVVANIPLPTHPRGVAVDASANRIYVASAGAGVVSVIDGVANAVVATIPVVGAPIGVALNSATGRVYVADGWSDDITIIDVATNTVLGRVAVGDNPSGAVADVAVNPTTGRIYASSYSDGTVAVMQDVLPPTPTPRTHGVGGKVKLPPAAIAAESGASAEDSGWTAPAYAALVGGALVLAAGAWYVRRRWLT